MKNGRGYEADEEDHEREQAGFAPRMDDDDLPEWTDEMLDVAAFAIGGTVIRPATGTLGPNGAVRGRPPIGDADRE